mmetsp:Transcript_21541/g.34581  ORF Transcript_21541/g.34581 Transcript_21541/m.34581 type:complete len:282 (+) Transcript_21541:47-892(+)
MLRKLEDDRKQLIALLNELSFEAEEPTIHSKRKWTDLCAQSVFINDIRFKNYEQGQHGQNMSSYEQFEQFCWRLTDAVEPHKKKLKQFLKAQQYVISPDDTVVKLMDKFGDALQSEHICEVPIIRLLFAEMIAKQQHKKQKTHNDCDLDDPKEHVQHCKTQIRDRDRDREDDRGKPQPAPAARLQWNARKKYRNIIRWKATGHHSNRQRQQRIHRKIIPPIPPPPKPFPVHVSFLRKKHLRRQQMIARSIAFRTGNEPKLRPRSRSIRERRNMHMCNAHNY